MRLVILVSALATGLSFGCSRRLTPREHKALMVHFHKLDVRGCRQAILARKAGSLRVAGTKATLSEFLAYNRFVTQCDDTFRQRLCGQAWTISQFVWTPARRVRVLVEGCRRAYCPLFTGKKPALCARSTVPDDPTPDWRQARQLMAAALRLESEGRATSAELDRFNDLIGLSGPIGSVSGERGKAVDFEVRMNLKGVDIRANIATIRWKLQADPTASDYRRVLYGMQLMRLARGDVDVSVSLHPRWDSRVKTRLVQLLRTAGFSRVTSGPILIN